MIEHLRHGDLNLGIVVRSNYTADGIRFFTSDEDPLQIGYMHREEGYVIQPHSHNPVERKITRTHEVLFIRSGRVRIDFYTEEKEYLSSTIVSQGDIVLLAEGGHGFKMLETAEIIEVKQGPYVGNLDKNRFDPVDDNLVKDINETHS